MKDPKFMTRLSLAALILLVLLMIVAGVLIPNLVDEPADAGLSASVGSILELVTG